MFTKLYSEQFKEVEKKPTITRSPKLIGPTHSKIAEYIRDHSDFQTISYPESEYNFVADYGSKKIDIAIFAKEANPAVDRPIGVILFKAIRSEYNKNANNYYENMKGESTLFIENNIPVYQIIFIPTLVKHNKSYEVPTEKSYNNYCNFIQKRPNYWDLLKLGIWYFDIDYTNFNVKYSEKTVPGVENTLEEGLNNFIERIKQHNG